MRKYYSIRVIKAKNLQHAFEEIISENFCNDDDLCDKIMTRKELIFELNKITHKKHGQIATFMLNAVRGDVLYSNSKDKTITAFASVYNRSVKTERMYAIKKDNANEVENLVKITML